MHGMAVWVYREATPYYLQYEKFSVFIVDGDNDDNVGCPLHADDVCGVY